MTQKQFDDAVKKMRSERKQPTITIFKSKMLDDAFAGVLKNIKFKKKKS